jgi:hypothetical protein
MKPLIALISFLVLVLSPACSPKVTQTRSRLTPSSYQDYQSSVPRSVGLLRRLVILPPHCVYIHNGKRQPDQEAQYCADIMTKASSFLRDWKGYDIILYPGNRTPGRIASSQVLEQADPALPSLFNWLENYDRHATVPPEVKTFMADLQRRFGADGVLVFRGFRRPSSTWNKAAAVLTASLTWPLLFLEEKDELQIYLFESSTGDLVWHCLGWSDVERSLASLENAVPAALLKK